MQGHQTPYLGAPVSIPESNEAQVLSSVSEELPRKITPIPIHPIRQPAEILQSFQQRDAEYKSLALETAQKLKEEKKIGTIQVVKRFLGSDVEVIDKKPEKTKEQTGHVQMAQNVMGARVDEE